MELKKHYYKEKEVRLVEHKITIPNVYALKKIGAGHDGIVYKLNDDIVVKILKYDVAQRKEKDLMTFQKANYFSENLRLKRIAVPIDTVLDTDGVYTGYVMEFLDDLSKENKSQSPNYKKPGDFTCGDLVYAAAELQEDFEQLTKAKVSANDINRGSYIFTPDFLHLCDTDKYTILGQAASDPNLKALNFAISKFLFYEMQKLDCYSKEDLKTLSAWVKKCSNSRTFLRELNDEIGSDFKTPISEYTEYKIKQITKR